tara:strand:- start:3846 stop:4124 length:279 start_codon:yes stop_codon:yes gene_type:complete
MNNNLDIIISSTICSAMYYSYVNQYNDNKHSIPVALFLIAGTSICSTGLTLLFSHNKEQPKNYKEIIGDDFVMIIPKSEEEQFEKKQKMLKK